MSEELEVLKIVAERLRSAGIAYMVTGSIAMNHYAVPRMTRDIDLVVELSAADVDRVCHLFEGDFYVDRQAVHHAVEGPAAFNMIHTALVVKVDIVVRKETEYRRTEFARRRRIAIERREVFVVAPEDLILSKLEWARDSRSALQLADVRNLAEAVTDLDRPYLAGWIERSGTFRALSRGDRMRDTPPDVDARYRQMLLARPGEDRLRMGFSMYATARAMVVASILAKEPAASPERVREAIFLRFYGRDFDETARDRIVARLVGGHSGDGGFEHGHAHAPS